MAQCKPRPHTSNNRKADKFGQGYTPAQERAQAASRRLESDGMSAGLKSGKKYQALVEARDAAQAQLIIAESILAANYSREAHAKRKAMQRAYLEACDTVSRF